MSERAYLIDASMVFFRYYFTLPDRWQSECGQVTSAAYGFSHWLKRFINDIQPKYISACFDESLGTCFRNQIYPDYKISRPPPDENIYFQFNACKKMCELWGVPTFASTEFEADDLIGTLLQLHQKKGRSSTIISRDKDLGQLLSEGDILWFYPDGEKLTPTQIFEKFGVMPAQMADLQALCGDKIDDIPGVPGVGVKTAAKFIHHFGGVDKIFDRNINPLLTKGEQRTREKLIEHEEQIRMAKSLTVIRTDVPLPQPARMKKAPAEKSALIDYSQKLGFDLSKIEIT